MNPSEEAFLKELLNDFKIEAAEHYESVVSGLLKLDSVVPEKEREKIIETVFREVHSLKGASRAVNLPEIEKICMSLETAFGLVKKKELELHQDLSDQVLHAMELMKLYLSAIDAPSKKPHPGTLGHVLKNLDFLLKNKKNAVTDLVQPYPAIGKESQPLTGQEEKIHPPEPVEADFEPVMLGNAQSPIIPDNVSKKPSENETIRISTSKLNAILQQSEELIISKSTIDYLSSEIDTAISSLMGEKNKIHETEEKIQGLEIEPGNAKTGAMWSQYDILLKNHIDALTRINKEVVRFRQVLARNTDQLLTDIRSTLLYPFSSLLSIVPKIVRDLGKEFSKRIDVSISGDHIEIDRRILEEIKDPLIHIVRNCMDHGIEPPHERKKAGKSETGHIQISILQEIDSRIILTIRDDGAGIDKNRVISSAVKNGVIQATEADRLSDEEVYRLIFSSGVSSSHYITNISGRGLGMAIVAEKVEKLGGHIELTSVSGTGTTFTLVLPQTIATYRGILVRTTGQYFTVPTNTVERALRTPPGEIKTVGSRKTILIGGEAIAWVSLSDLISLPGARAAKDNRDYVPALILNVNQKKMALAVDEVIGEMEGLVKDLGPQLIHVKNIAGATITGDGRVVLILNVNELMDTAAHKPLSSDMAALTESSGEMAEQKQVLIAEDSVTIRTMLRTFVENAGYRVKTAVDGYDGYQKLLVENFDLVVSDIEMPRMNGFELTAKIRENKKLSDIPVILVTALESSDDRQRGLEAGANAYIVKSSFEKSDLIETIQRLI